MQPILSSDIVKATVTLNAAFIDGMGSYTPVANQLARELPVDSLTAEMAWHSVDTDMQEYDDEELPESVENEVIRDYKIPIRRFRKFRRVAADFIKYGKLGTAVQIMRDYGAAIAEFPDRQLATLLNNGTTLKCWDGVAMFHAAHPLSPNKTSTTFANLLTAKPLSQANYRIARSTLKKMQREDGSNMGLKGDVLVVDPTNEDLAREIVNASIINNTTNVLQGSSQIVVLNYLNAGAWYLASSAEQNKGLVKATLEAPRMIPPLVEGSEYTAQTDAYLYIARCKMGFGYNLPQFIVRVNES